MAGAVKHVVYEQLGTVIRAPPSLPLERQEMAPIPDGLGGAQSTARVETEGLGVDVDVRQGLPVVLQGSLVGEGRRRWGEE